MLQRCISLDGGALQTNLAAAAGDQLPSGTWSCLKGLERAEGSFLFLDAWNFINRRQSNKDTKVIVK